MLRSGCGSALSSWHGWSGQRPSWTASSTWMARTCRWGSGVLAGKLHALMLAARMHGFAHSCACSCSKLPASLPCILQVVTEAGTRTAGPRNALKVHSVSWLELACRFAGVLPGRYRACWRMRLSGHYVFTGGRLVVRHLPATGPAALAALAAGGQDPLLPVLQEDGVRGQLRANAAPEPHEARSQLTLVTRAHLDEEFRQV